MYDTKYYAHTHVYYVHFIYTYITRTGTAESLYRVRAQFIVRMCQYGIYGCVVYGTEFTIGGCSKHKKK